MCYPPKSVSSASSFDLEGGSGIECYSYHDGHPMCMRNLYNVLKVWHVIPRIANTLNVYRFCFVVDQFLNFLRLISVYEFGCYP